MGLVVVTAKEDFLVFISLQIMESEEVIRYRHPFRQRLHFRQQFLRIVANGAFFDVEILAQLSNQGFVFILELVVSVQSQREIFLCASVVVGRENLANQFLEMLFDVSHSTDIRFCRHHIKVKLFFKHCLNLFAEHFSHFIPPSPLFRWVVSSI